MKSKINSFVKVFYYKKRENTFSGRLGVSQKQTILEVNKENFVDEKDNIVGNEFTVH